MARGRRSKYTPEVVDLCCEGIMLGFTDKHAAEYAGISEDSFQRYENTYADFAARIREAHAKRRRMWLGELLKAGKKDWRAIADLLDRCEPDYRKKTVQEQQHTGKDGAPLTVIIGQREDGPQ